MAEETTAQDAITADDWGAAMAEQTTAEPAATQPHVFEQFAGAGGAKIGRAHV